MSATWAAVLSAAIAAFISYRMRLPLYRKAAAAAMH